MKHKAHYAKSDVSFVQCISRKITLFLNKLAPPGYEDGSGFHFGVEPGRRKHPVRAQGRVAKNKLRPRPKTKAKPRTTRRFDYKLSPAPSTILPAV